MESTIQQYNKILAIIAGVLLLLFTFLFFHSHDFTTTQTIPQVEVLQWSADTCWGRW
jgi:hypothetical protein